MMIETEDIDDDYFTPASSTSLANIFGKIKAENKSVNETLKYTPPKPTNLSLKPEEEKSTQCIYACALLGYEWSDGYVSRGKLGFAIIKIIKSGIHNIVLYDSNKLTISIATIKSSFEVNIKEKGYFSYLDDQQRYWSLMTSEDETRKILDLLKSLDVSIKCTPKDDKGPNEPKKNEKVSTMRQACKEDKESDTDSSVNRRTKLSILNRMASMGQSVLPPHAVSAEKSSDSSDTTEANHHKVVRHKPSKSSVKRNNSDKNIFEYHNVAEPDRVLSTSLEPASQTASLLTYSSNQMMPITSSNLVNSSNSSTCDMNYFISEQRISNSELRINMNRVIDRVDQLYDRMSDIDKVKSSNSNFQFELLQKLLTEYENKIKMYENYMRSKGLERDLGIHLISSTSKEQSSQEIMLNTKILQLEQVCQEKDTNISNLEAEIKLLQAKYDADINKEKYDKSKLLEEIENLHAVNKEQLRSANNNIKKYDDSISNKIKDIMNDTFQEISGNFEDSKNYSGEIIKNAAATVIKKVTIESLSALYSK